MGFAGHPPSRFRRHVDLAECSRVNKIERLPRTSDERSFDCTTQVVARLKWLHDSSGCTTQVVARLKWLGGPKLGGDLMMGEATSGGLPRIRTTFCNTFGSGETPMRTWLLMMVLVLLVAAGPTGSPTPNDPVDQWSGFGPALSFGDPPPSPKPPLPPRLRRPLEAKLPPKPPLPPLSSLSPLELAKKLFASKSSERFEAAEKLAAIGPAAAEVLPQLAKALKDEKWYVRHEVLIALRRIGPQGTEAIPQAIEALSDEEPAVRVEAAHMLGHLGSPAKQAIPQLVKLLDDPSELVRVRAAWALASIESEHTKALDKALPKLLQAFSSQDEELQAEAVEALQEIGGPAVPALNNILASENQPRQKALAADALAGIGAAAQPAVSNLKKLLQSKNQLLAYRAARALASIGPGAREATEQLIAALQSESPLVRVHAARALGEIQAKDPKCIEGLIALVGDSEDFVQREAIDSLMEIKPDPKKVFPPLMRALKDSSPEVRSHAIHALSEIGKLDVDQLITALGDEETRYSSCVLLGELGPEAAKAVPELAQAATQSESYATRIEALIALAKIGEAAKSALPKILKSLDDKGINESASLKSGVQIATCFALGSLGQPTDEVIEKLEQFLSVEDPFLRRVAAWALAKLTPENEQRVDRALKLLAEGLVDDDPRVRSVSAQGFSKLDQVDPRRKLMAFQKVIEGGDLDKVVKAMDAIRSVRDLSPEVLLPVLTEGLGQEETRQGALVVLAEFGEQAAVAVPQLVDLLKTSDEDSAQAGALFALGNIGPKSAPAVPTATKILGDPSRAIRLQRSACFLLGKVGSPAKSAVPTLKKTLSSDDPFLPRLAAWAIVQIDPQQVDLRTFLPLLEGALYDDNPMVRAEFARVLGMLGPEAASAVARLREMAADPDRRVALAAQQALGKIER